MVYHVVVRLYESSYIVELIEYIGFIECTMNAFEILVIIQYTQGQPI